MATRASSDVQDDQQTSDTRTKSIGRPAGKTPLQCRHHHYACPSRETARVVIHALWTVWSKGTAGAAHSVRRRYGESGKPMFGSGRKGSPNPLAKYVSGTKAEFDEKPARSPVAVRQHEQASEEARDEGAQSRGRRCVDGSGRVVLSEIAIMIPMRPRGKSARRGSRRSRPTPGR